MALLTAVCLLTPVNAKNEETTYDEEETVYSVDDLNAIALEVFPEYKENILRESSELETYETSSKPAQISYDIIFQRLSEAAKMGPTTEVGFSIMIQNDEVTYYANGFKL